MNGHSQKESSNRIDLFRIFVQLYHLNSDSASMFQKLYKVKSMPTTDVIMTAKLLISIET